MIKDFEFSKNYEIIQSVGSGSFADIWLGKHKLVGEKVGIKIIDKKKFKHLNDNKSTSDDQNTNESENDEEIEINQKFKIEVSFMELLKPQAFLLQLFNFFETPNYYHIILEYGQNGNLAQQLMMYKERFKTYKNKNNDINIENENIIDFSDENEIKNVFAQIVRTVIFLHEKCHLAHRDLKAENIVFDDNMNIKIIDFGLCCRIISNNNIIDQNYNKDDNNDTNNQNNDNSSKNSPEMQWILEDQSTCGPPNYVPPEMILRNTVFGPEVDTWMLGVLLYFIVYNCFPYHSHDIRSLISEIAYLDYSVPETRIIVKEYVKIIKSNHKSSKSSQTDTDDDDDNNEFSFLKQDLFSTFPKRKPNSTKKSSKNHFLMDEINFFGSRNNFLSSSDDDENDDSNDNSNNNLMSSTKDDKKVITYKEIEVEVSESCRDLIKKMLCKDPRKRITLKDVFKHRWILEAKEFVKENENKILKPEESANLQLEQELEQKQIKKSLMAAKLTTIFAEKNNSELSVMKNISVINVVESFFKNKELPFDLETIESQLNNNIYNENTEIVRILLCKEERKQFKELINNLLNEK